MPLCGAAVPTLETLKQEAKHEPSANTCEGSSKSLNVLLQRWRGGGHLLRRPHQRLPRPLSPSAALRPRTAALDSALIRNPDNAGSSGTPTTPWVQLVLHYQGPHTVDPCFSSTAHAKGAACGAGLLPPALHGRWPRPMLNPQAHGICTSGCKLLSKDKRNGLERCCRCTIGRLDDRDPCRPGR